MSAPQTPLTGLKMIQHDQQQNHTVENEVNECLNMSQETTYIIQVPFESKGEIYLKLPSGLSDEQVMKYLDYTKTMEHSKIWDLACKASMWNAVKRRDQSIKIESID
tara:strand:+ start:864 stop:1184 length:321 start_codon:yes stop_codon:yes gene_type:complete